MKKQEKSNVCELCRREVDRLSRHHLVPREEGGRYGPTAELCQPCHSSVHNLLTNRELALFYNTIPALEKAEALQKYLRWVRKRPLNRICNRRGRRKDAK